ncbi:UNVERIFIED_CONTAM: hypothetical protein K2H54_027780 [Gekko kuhli]
MKAAQNKLGSWAKQHSCGALECKTNPLQMQKSSVFRPSQLICKVTSRFVVHWLMKRTYSAFGLQHRSLDVPHRGQGRIRPRVMHLLQRKRAALEREPPPPKYAKRNYSVWVAINECFRDFGLYCHGAVSNYQRLLVVYGSHLGCKMDWKNSGLCGMPWSNIFKAQSFASVTSVGPFFCCKFVRNVSQANPVSTPFLNNH